MKETQLQFTCLPSYLTICCLRGDYATQIVVTSKVHTISAVQLPTAYNNEYVDNCHESFRKDVLRAVIREFGLTPNPVTYS
jgi:hypothetical protein